MKKILIILILLGSVIVFFYLKNNKKENVGPNQGKTVTHLSDAEPSKSPIRLKSLFVPSWSINEASISADYDRYIYFAVTATKDGVTKSDDGYKKIDKFMSSVPSGKKKYITLRIVDEEAANYLLQNADLQNKITQETIDIVKNNQFEGIVLDLELSNFINPDIPQQIDNFVQSFYLSAKKYYIPFFLTIYGDTFYRKRPFDLKFLSKNSDEIMIMAYDLHKSGGEPGPNFQLSGKASYGYDFKSMLEDFSSIVPKDKLTVIFGMFGYDWTVDENKLPIKPAEALSLNDIRKKFLGKCVWQDCVVKRDKISSETEVDYVISEVKDDYGYLNYHVVWFEDEESVRAKTDYLQDQGVGSIAYWANGYF